MPRSAAAEPGLSKSLFMKGWQCAKSLWLHRKRKDLIPAVDPARQWLFDQGRLVGEWARRRFPGGVLIDAPPADLSEAAKSTERTLAKGAEALFEATFRHDGLLVRTDILRRVPKGGWDLLEVKMSTEAKVEHVPDLAVQALALEGAGLPVRKACLLLIDNAYVRRGAVDPALLFKEIDLTADVRGALPEIGSLLEDLKAVLAQPRPPELEIGRRCFEPYDCEFRAHCWEGIPDYSVYDLPRLRVEKADELRRKGILAPADVPKAFKLSPYQRLQVDIAREGKPRIDTAALKRRLATLKAPLQFLDFETANPAVPPYDGLRPYQQLPFQFSLRVGQAHAEFLGDGKGDPREALAAKLAASLKPQGSVVAYHASFEGRVLGELAAEFPRHAPALLSAKERLWDLEPAFSTGEYAHPGFRGSSSIKAILPVLVPGLGYEGLDIAEGSAASRAYMSLMSGELAPEEAERVRRALTVYCGRDTEAMAALLRVLCAAAGVEMPGGRG